MEQTLTYNRKALIASFEKKTGITQSVKIDSVLEAKTNYKSFNSIIGNTPSQLY
ncbi:MAG TPA: hypothetical protein PLJ42_11075 [Chitinophagales bacterium]|nr:hypothetical protein [Chitinophagales bacterium]MBP6155263.1 hypothetical protein [Chitinophagales bacterium]HQV78994.1 hypothetical protein [Chitinophagales bacterium]HQW79964.1 hypothetical protein [Chitinophagales bacterium]